MGYAYTYVSIGQALMFGISIRISRGSKTERLEQASWLGEQRMRVTSALRVLSPAQREAIEMAYFSGMSQSELADKLKEPIGTVKARIRLGMIKLREHLGNGASVR